MNRLLKEPELGAALKFRKSLLFCTLLRADIRAELLGRTLTQSIEYDIPFLNKLDFDDSISLASPFFWLNLGRSLSPGFRKSADISAIRRFIALTAFDSFFDILPSGAYIQIPRSSYSLCPLPRLGLAINWSTPLRIAKDNSGRLDIIDLDHSRPLSVSDYSRGELAAWGLQSTPRHVVLSCPSICLFEEIYLDQLISPDLASEFAPSIDQALSIIEAADPALWDRLRGESIWYVPISSPDPTVHASFSSPQLTGVVFLSYSDNPFTLAEAIVHEYGHSELNSFDQISPITTGNSKQLYYSPWRRDLRPLLGLMHALYVFILVAEFYERLSASPLANSVPTLEIRWNATVHRLRLGLAQVRQVGLTVAGRELVSDISCRIKRQSEILGIDAHPTLPVEIRDHLRRFGSHRRMGALC
jgi:hypothetical protein